MPHQNHSPLNLLPEETPTTAFRAPTTTSGTTYLSSPSTVYEGVEDYLDHLSARLLTLSYVQRAGIRDEVRQHLSAAISAREELGQDTVTAVRETLHLFGTVEIVADQFIRSYASTGDSRSLFPWRALRRGLRIYGIAGLCVPLFLHMLMTEIRAGLLPYGPGVEYFLWFLILLVLPLLLGRAVGDAGRTPRAGLGSLYALGILALAASPIAFYTAFSPGYIAWLEPWALIPYFFALWIPLACFAAGISRLVTFLGRRLRYA